MATTVLSVASRAVLCACERLGLDGDRLLAAAELTRAQISDPDARLPAARADALWRHAYERAADPHLALHAAEALPFGAYKVVDYLGAHSASVGDAVTRIASYFDLVDGRARLDVTLAGPTARMTMSTARGAPIAAPAQDFTLAAIVTRVRAIAGPFPLDAVEFAHEAPSITTEYARVFAAPIVFGAPKPGLRFSASAWATPIRAADPSLLSVLEAHARHLRAELPKHDGLRRRAHDALVEELRARRSPTITALARKLAMSDRTLQRRLKGDGSSFVALLDDARGALARSYVRDPELALAEVAWLVGFADQSSFTRAFKRWTGQAPGAWRSHPHGS